MIIFTILSPFSLAHFHEYLDRLLLQPDIARKHFDYLALNAFSFDPEN